MSDDPTAQRYCLRCYSRLLIHPLDESGPSKCARCGLPYVPDQPETYSPWPRPFRWNLWVPGLLIAIVAGILAYAAGVEQGTLGYVAFFGVPFAVGLILGFSTRSPASWLLPLLSLLATVAIVFALIAMNLSGLFCGAILGAMFLGPVLVGGLIGWAVRILAKGAAWDRRRFFILALFVGSPIGAQEVETRLGFEKPIVEVSTSATFDAPPRATWDAIILYEEVEHEPPLLLKLALPRPVRAEGSKAAVGDVERCIYVRGSMVKTITSREELRFLAFDVSEQHLHFEHDVELVDGSFILQPIGDRQTRVILTTRYRRLLRPAWLWQWMEREIIHTLHEHILEGMRRRAEPG
jgi:hypothetical protein